MAAGRRGPVVVVLLARSRRIPGTFVLLLIGLDWTATAQPDLLPQLRQVGPKLHWPTWVWPRIGWNELVLGVLGEVSRMYASSGAAEPGLPIELRPYGCIGCRPMP